MIRRLLCVKIGTLSLVLLVRLIAGDKANAAPDTVTIDAVKIAANQVIVDGNLGTGSVTVSFGSSALQIVSSSSTRIVATLNPVPPIGSYRVAVTVGNKSATAYATVADKILTGTVNANGSYAAGSPFTVVHNYAGNYTIMFPAGTFQIGSPYVFPILSVKPMFGTAAANVTGYLIAGDQSGGFALDFAGIDTLFQFTVVQTY